MTLAAAEQQPAEPQAEDLGALDAEIAKAQATLQALAQGARRAAAEKAVERARQAVEDADVVAKACAPGGVRASLLARAVKPFTDAANGFLRDLAPGYEVQVSESFELLVRAGGRTLRPSQLSDGERTRLLYVLQLAVADLSGLRLLVLDRGELLDAAGKTALKVLIAACAASGVQVLMLSCAPPPAAAPPGLTVYVMEAGRSRAVT